MWRIEYCSEEKNKKKHNQYNQGSDDHDYDPQTIDVISSVSLLMDRRIGCTMH